VAQPFEVRDAPKEGPLARIFGGRGGGGAIAEIETLLARAPRVREVSAESVAAVTARHGVELGTRLRTARKNLYRRFLEHCLNDGALSADENADLVHLRALLHLEQDDVSRLHDDVATSVYGEAVDHVLQDHRLDADERAFLERLRGDLGLAPDVAARLYEQGSEAARQRYLQRAVVPDSVIVRSAGARLELVGASDKSLEDAVRAALDEALRAVPRLTSAEVREIRTDLADGRIARWRVKVRAALDRPD
jgi:flavin-binding protein dodecin